MCLKFHPEDRSDKFQVSVLIERASAVKLYSCSHVMCFNERRVFSRVATEEG